MDKDFKVQVDRNGIITKWFLMNSDVSLLTTISKTSNYNTSQSLILPGFYKRRSRGRGYLQVTVSLCPDCKNNYEEEISDLKSEIADLENQLSKYE